MIARAGGEPVGFAVWFHNYSTFLARRGSVSRRSVRRAGVARPAASAARCWRISRGIAVARDCGRMEWSVLDWNEPAIGFYRSIGAKPMDGWTVFRLTGDDLATGRTEQSPKPEISTQARDRSDVRWWP